MKFKMPKPKTIRKIKQAADVAKVLAPKDKK